MNVADFKRATPAHDHTGRPCPSLPMAWLGGDPPRVSVMRSPGITIDMPATSACCPTCGEPFAVEE